MVLHSLLSKYFGNIPVLNKKLISHVDNGGSAHDVTFSAGEKNSNHWAAEAQTDNSNQREETEL